MRTENEQTRTAQEIEDMLLRAIFGDNPQFCDICGALLRTGIEEHRCRFEYDGQSEEN